MTSVQIIIPMQSTGDAITLYEVVTVLAVVLLVFQYTLLVLFVIFNYHFTSKLHALAWFIPGWPVLEYMWQFIRNFMKLD